MWLITPVGFFSIVQKPDDQSAGTLTIRARLRGDLLALKQGYLPSLGVIKESGDTDYRFRAKASRSELAAAMASLVEGLDYSNFKSAVGKRQGGARANLYHDVWSVLYKLQTDAAFEEKKVVADSYGGVVVSGGNRVLLREPTNHYGGCAWTFAKTTAKSGESPRDTALRAVREKTGYEATIRISVPGLYTGTTSAANYYVMDAKHPPARPGWQTSGLRWVTFDDARALIRESLNAAVRDRDLAILEAAEKSASSIPDREHARVQPEDWNDLHEMPACRTILRPALHYTAEEMEKIQRGFCPTVMEQKWFLYFTGDRLRMHRSWSGFLIFDVGFEREPAGGASVTEVIVNRDPRQSGGKDDEEDLKLVENLIWGHLLEPLDEPAVDGFVKGMTLASQPNYLGSPEVVSDLVGEIFSMAIKTIKGEASAEDLQNVTSQITAAFTDEEAGYTQMPGWHSSAQLGRCIEKYLLGMQESLEWGSFAEIIGTGFVELLEKIQELMISFREDPGATWQDHALVQLNALHDYVVAVLLGTNTLTYGERTLADFHWCASTKVDADQKQAIVLLGGEGGEIALVGIKADTGWKFRVETSESTTIELLDTDEKISTSERTWVTTWRSALKQFDSFPWPQLYPLQVHVEFRTQVMKTLKARAKNGLDIDWVLWGKALAADGDE